jgi:hypothetical protein
MLSSKKIYNCHFSNIVLEYIQTVQVRSIPHYGMCRGHVFSESLMAQLLHVAGAIFPHDHRRHLKDRQAGTHHNLGTKPCMVAFPSEQPLLIF